MTKNEKQGMNRVENDMHTAQQNRRPSGIAHLLRTAIFGLALTLGLTLGNGSAQAEEGDRDTRQEQRNDREQADDKKDSDKKDDKAKRDERDHANDSQPTITLTAPATGSVKLYPAAFELEAAVSFPGRSEGRNDQREGIEIEFLVNGRKFAEAERAPYRASYTPPRAGIYTLSARIRYGEGKRTILSDAVTVVSNIAPSVNLTVPANNTVQTAPATFTLTADAAAQIGSIAKVEFYNGTTLVGTATGAPYGITWNNVPAGSYTLTAKATDNYGISSTSVPVTVISNASPTVSLTSPVPNTVSAAPGSFTLTANAADTDGAITKVEFYGNGALIGSATAAPYSHTWSNVPAGNYTITAIATDNLGASTTSAAVAVVSDAPPTVSLTGPAANTVSTAPGSFTLTADAASSMSTIAKVEFYNGATLLGTATSIPYSHTWSNVPAGTYNLTAKATDSLGISNTSAAVSITSNAAPTVDLTAPLNNAGYTTPSAITLNATAADSDGTLAKVDFYNGATLLGTATAAPYSYSWNDAPIGTYTLTVIATDNLGASATSAATTVTVIAPPVVSLTGPASNAVVTAPATFTLSADATSAGSIAKVDFYNGATLIGTATAAPYTFTWTNVPAGSYTITAVATDGNGATTTSAPVSVTANAAPAVSLTSPTANSVLAAPASFTLTADATDSDGTITQVDFYNGTTLIGTSTTAPYSYSWSNVPSGNYTITAIATDNHGASTTSAAVAVTSNQLPTVSLTGPADGAQITSPNSFNLTADAADADGSIAKVEFYNGTILLGTATTAPYSYTWANVPVGNYSLTAIATDSHGGQANSQAISVTAIANVPPSVSLTGPANGTTMKVPGSFTLTADAASTTSAIAKVDFYAIDNATNASTLIGTATQTPYTANWSNVPLGDYTLSAVATDTLDTVTTSSPVTVTVNSGIAQAYYIHADHLDTPRAITDASGNVVWRWDNTDPFGNNIPNENPNGAGRFGFNLRFPGQYFDKETGLHYNFYRDGYNPEIGAYTQSDPIGLLGGINTYTYVVGNPISLVDPDGLDAMVCLYSGAGPAGHVGIGINSSSTIGLYPRSESPGLAGIIGTPAVVKPDTKSAEQCKKISTTAEQDKKMADFIARTTTNPGTYRLGGNNCTNFVRSVLRQAGVSTSDSPVPRIFFPSLRGKP